MNQSNSDDIKIQNKTSHISKWRKVENIEIYNEQANPLDALRDKMSDWWTIKT